MTCHAVQYIPNLSNFNGVEAAEIFNHTGCAALQGARRGHRASGAVVCSPRRGSQRKPRRSARAAGPLADDR